ncbi:hypothetical protein CRG98_043993 [Punica granatum]|uniref:Uncharacterized protein n=1 Tax=Punica granatum TaxID=22663 RepID=A0A2I0HV05_PUNGR|nr:hypothetical protein CRG98_043993 [Punica granatum]
MSVGSRLNQISESGNAGSITSHELLHLNLREFGGDLEILFISFQLVGKLVYVNTLGDNFFFPPCNQLDLLCWLMIIDLTHWKDRTYEHSSHSEGVARRRSSDHPELDGSREHATEWGGGGEVMGLVNVAESGPYVWVEGRESGGMKWVWGNASDA